MITRRYEVDNLVGVEISLGRVGENGARTIEFDVRPWVAHHPGGFVVVYVMPPAHQHHHHHTGMHQSHPSHEGYLAMTTYQDGIVSWVVTQNDTRAEGNGAVELILYGQNNEVLQSTVVKTKISRSLSHSGSGCNHGMNPNQPWVDQVARMAMAAQDAAERAEIAADNAANVAVENFIPTGGTKNQFLGKMSDEDHDIGWMDPPHTENVQAKQHVVNCPTKYDFPQVGDPEVIYKAEKEERLYQWDSISMEYEPLSSAGIEPEQITIIHGGNAYGTN